MKNSIKKVLMAITALCLLGTAPLRAVDLGIYAGLSAPNDEINNVMKLTDNNTIGKFIREAAEVGYHIGIKTRIPMSENFIFRGGIAYHSFPETKLFIETHQEIPIVTSQNIIPVSAGVNFYLLKSVVGVYATGELTYNYISSSVDYVKDEFIKIGIPLEKTDPVNTVGFGLGVGVDFDLKLVTLNLEAKYSRANLVGGSDEFANPINYFSLSLGVLF
ncbi:MAG: outer membrane beta-barrel protein [Chlorobi bacterium]|nr:outer membrane beta-barrel protein [Chlorobiota bacterium]